MPKGSPEDLAWEAEVRALERKPRSPAPKARKQYLGKRHSRASHYRTQLQWRAGDPCMYCNGPRETWDHMDPKQRGGVNRPENLGPCCKRCNSQKHAKPLLVFLAERRH